MTVEPGLVIRGGRVWTDGRELPALHTVIVRGGRIESVLPDRLAGDRIGAADRVIDARGASVTPGLHDAHLHVVEWARSLDEVDVTGSRSREEVRDHVARHRAAHPGTDVVIGRGWDAEGWPAPPTREVLDGVAAAYPVVLHARDFHAVWANGVALERCGITSDTPDPAGGRIVRDPSGRPTGVLMEHAVRLVASLLAPDPERDARALERAVARLHGFGITAIQDFEGAHAHRLLRELTRGPARLRVLMHVPHALLDHAVALGLSSGTGDDTFRMGSIKLFADGTLTSRTAALLEPYAGTSERGMDLMSADELRDTVRRAFTAGWSVAVHAIGDRAARATLDAFEASREWIPSLSTPPRIEHLQLVHPDDQPRLAALGVAASMQPQHAVTDAEQAVRHWGARVAHSYPWASLLERGTAMAFGSDAPVEPPDPALGLHAAVTRESPSGAAFTPEQRVTLDQALTAYTEGPARLAMLWPRAGTLRPSAWADVVVWNTVLDPSDPAALREARPAATLVGGEVVYEAPATNGAGSPATTRERETAPRGAR